MTLEEAIKHCEEVAKDKELSYKFCFHAGKSCDGQQPDREDLVNCKNNGCLKCAAEHRQLAEWLRELKELRIENKALKNRCADFEHGAPCRYCPLDCEFRKHEFEGEMMIGRVE